MNNYVYGNRSRQVRATLSPKLVTLVDTALEHSECDIALLCGLRGKVAQNQAYDEHTSHIPWPFGRHNVYRMVNRNSALMPREALINLADPRYEKGRMVIAPSKYDEILDLVEEDPTGKASAVDMVPWIDGGIPWQRRRVWYQFAGYIKGVGLMLKTPLIWGGDWDSDLTYTDQRFHDLPHYQEV